MMKEWKKYLKLVQVMGEYADSLLTIKIAISTMKSKRVEIFIQIEKNLIQMM